MGCRSSTGGWRVERGEVQKVKIILSIMWLATAGELGCVWLFPTDLFLWANFVFCVCFSSFSTWQVYSE